jgi:hypothetical protein
MKKHLFYVPMGCAIAGLISYLALSVKLVMEILKEVINVAPLHPL